MQQHIDDLKELNDNISIFKNTALKQLDAIDFNTKEFHKTLIDLLSKYPEQKDILEFTVYINDRIEMNQVQFKDVVKDIFLELVKYKQEMIKSNIQMKKHSMNKEENTSVEPKKGETKMFDNLLLIKDIKTILMIIMVIVFSIGFIFAPTQTTQLFEWFKTIFII